jgi:hypothetical protein
MYRKIIAAFMIASLSSSAGADTLLECSQIENADERMACYDDLAGRVEEKMEDSYEGTTEQRVEARNESINEEIVGSDEPAPELMSLEIKKVHRDRSGRLVYQMTDGRLFKRSSSSMISFRAGDKFNLESGVMGSVFLVREDGKKNKVKELSSN